MIYVITGMSLLYVAIGFVITEKNAKYLLSGYNTMRDEDRKKVDIKAYIPYFRNFHIFLGVSLLVSGIALTCFISKNAGIIFIAVYPVIAYIYFVVSSSKKSNGLSSKWNKAAVLFLSGTLLFVIGLIGYAFRENKLVINSSRIELRGSYGEIINPSEILNVELVNHLPEIIFKTNGFDLGTIKKGYFTKKNGEIVKLILNSDNKPIILFTKTNGKEIYYSAKNKSANEVVDEMKKALPDIVYKE